MSAIESNGDGALPAQMDPVVHQLHGGSAGFEGAQDSAPGDIQAQILLELRAINENLVQVPKHSLRNRIIGGLAVATMTLGAWFAGVTYAHDQGEDLINSFSTKQFARDFAREGKAAACAEIEDLAKILPKDIKISCGFVKPKKERSSTLGTMPTAQTNG